MIPPDDPRRCPTCHGVHPGWRCPLTIMREPITDAQAEATRQALERATRPGHRTPIARATEHFSFRKYAEKTLIPSMPKKHA